MTVGENGRCAGAEPLSGVKDMRAEITALKNAKRNVEQGYQELLCPAGTSRPLNHCRQPIELVGGGADDGSGGGVGGARKGGKIRISERTNPSPFFDVSMAPTCGRDRGVPAAWLAARGVAGSGREAGGSRRERGGGRWRELGAGRRGPMVRGNGQVGAAKGVEGRQRAAKGGKRRETEREGEEIGISGECTKLPEPTCRQVGFCMHLRGATCPAKVASRVCGQVAEGGDMASREGTRGWDGAPS